MKYNKLSLLSLSAVVAIFLMDLMLTLKFIYLSIVDFGETLAPIRPDPMDTPSVLVLTAVLALIALVTGILSFIKIRKLNEKGKTLAIVGIICGFFIILRSLSAFNL